MKTLYPAPLEKNTTLDLIHTLQSRLAHRTRGSTRFSRVVRCRSKLLAIRLLNLFEQVFS